MYVWVIGVESVKDCLKFFHSDEQKNFAESKFFLSNGKVFFKIESIDGLIAAQEALEEMIQKNEKGDYYINITNS